MTADKAVLDVYLAPIPAEPGEQALLSPERMRALEHTRDPALRRQRYWVWHLLEEAAARSLGLDAEKLDFLCDGFGRWSCADFEFSLSHTAGLAAAAVSDRPVGVDIEELSRFAARYAGEPSLAEAVLRRIAAPEELESCAGRERETLLRLWTGKESLFKAGQSGSFSPKRLRPGAETRQLLVSLPPEVYVSVSGARVDELRLFRREGDAFAAVERERVGGPETLFLD